MIGGAQVLISVVLSLCFIFTLWKYRETRLLKAISIEFCTGSIVGCCLVCLSILGYPYESDDAACKTQPWLLPLGLSLVLSPLAARQWRLDRIFNAKDLLQKKNLTNLRLWGETVCGMLPQLLLSLLWSATASPYARVVVVDVNRPAWNYTECVYNQASDVFIALTFIWICMQVCSSL